MSDTQVLAARLRQAVQGCTVHTHGPVQAWQAVEDAIRMGKTTRTEVAAEATASSISRLRELAGAGVSDDDPRVRKERITLGFIRSLMRDDDSLAPGISGMDLLDQRVLEARTAVLEHPLYGSIVSIEHVRIFMEHHVFAVWDFMCLLKSLQRSVTCVEEIWRPVGDPVLRRLINEIVVGEESDLVEGETRSHFEMYLDAMREVGADTACIEKFIKSIEKGSLVSTSLDECGAPEGARRFVLSTMDVVHQGRAYATAAAFTVGREQTIPAMFPKLIMSLTLEEKITCPILLSYLDRHVTVDGTEHGPASKRLLTVLCAGDEIRWEAAIETANKSLLARVDLWDSVVDAFGKPVYGSARVHLPTLPTASGE
jgi:Protein of unknown function (DUF3050)